MLFYYLLLPYLHSNIWKHFTAYYFHKSIRDTLTFHLIVIFPYREYPTNLYVLHVSLHGDSYSLALSTLPIEVDYKRNVLWENAIKSMFVYRIPPHIFYGATAPRGPGPLIIETSQSNSNIPLWVGLLWTSDQLDAATSTWQHTTLTKDRNLWIPWDSNPQSLQSSGRRTTP